MGIAFRLFLYLMFFNIAVGMIFWAGTGVGAGNREWRVQGADPLAYAGQNTYINTTFDSSTTVPAQNNNNLWYRFLDIISLGLFTQIQTLLNNTLFAIPSLLTAMGMPSGMQVFINSILAIIYMVGIFELFTNKDISQR